MKNFASRRSSLHLLIIPFLAAVLIGALQVPIVQGGQLSGNWNSDLYLSSVTPAISQFHSTSALTYSSGAGTYSSTSVFSKSAFSRQLLTAQYRMGIFEASSTLNFDTSNLRLNYWLSR